MSPPSPPRLASLNGQARPRPAGDPKTVAAVKAGERLAKRPNRRVGNFAMIQPQLASISTVGARKLSEGEPPNPSRLDRIWQSLAYDFADGPAAVGELGYILNLTANAGAACNLVIKEMPARAPSSVEPVEEIVSEDPRPKNVMDSWTGPRGGKTELIWRYFYHHLVAGESIMLGTEQFDDDSAEFVGITWEMLSTKEIIINPGMPVMRRRDGVGGVGEGERVDPDRSYLARSWLSDPVFSNRATSSVKRVLRILAELVKLTQMVDAVISSHIPAGLLLIPEEFSFPAEDNEATNDDETFGDAAIDVFTRTLMQHLASAVENQESAARLVPLVLRGPAAYIDAVKFIPLSQDMATWPQQLRDECIQRLAAGLDIPPEILHGTAATSNHWGAWQVDIQFVVKHVAPIGNLLADFLTDAYLRPMLEVFWDMTPTDAGRFRLEFDVSPILTAADESNTARALYALDVITEEALVKRSGFDVGEMPTPEELVVKRAWELVKLNALMAPYVLKMVPGFEHVEVDVALGGRNPMLVAPADAEGYQVPPADVPQTGVPGVKRSPSGTGRPPQTPVNQPTPTPDGSTPPATPTSTSAATLVAKVAAAADGAVERALERAGSKLENRVRADKILRDTTGLLLAEVDKLDYLTVVKPQEMSRMRLTARELFDGSWDRLLPKVRQWVADHLQQSGTEWFLAAELAERAAVDLGRRLDVLVTGSPHQPIPVGANGLRVPDALVEAALGHALGLVTV